MRKLKLDVDALRVDSFPVSSGAAERAGTVHGAIARHTDTPPQPEPYTENILRCPDDTTGGGTESLGCPISTFEIRCITFTCL